MKKNFLIFILVLLMCSVSYSQKKATASQNPYARIDQQMLNNDSLNSLAAIGRFITTTFTSEYDKTRAIFYWITENIRYAPELMYSFTTNENKSKLVKNVFENRTGICLGYAVLFDTLCKLSNVQSYLILGSTKQSFLPSITGHAWNAVKIFDVWQIVDVTWGSGFLQNNHFVKQRKNYYFLPDPEKLILTHLPVDPIWQLLAHPITLYQFHSHLKSTISTDWNFQDSISSYLSSDEIYKIKGTRRRLAEFGNNSEVTSNYFNYLKSKELEYYHFKMTSALKSYNLAVEEYNAYIDFKNHQFTPGRPDEEIKQLLPQISANLESSTEEYSLIFSEITEVSYIDNITSNLKQIKDLKERVAEERKFVDKYLSTKKNKRRDLFYTKIYTVYGIPVK